MPKPLTLSIDAMGGDNAPGMVVEGVELALERLPDTRFILFGDEALLNPLLSAHPRAAAASEVRHTPDAIGNDDKPSVALRQGRSSSMRLAINAVGDGEVADVMRKGDADGSGHITGAELQAAVMAWYVDCKGLEEAEVKLGTVIKHQKGCMGRCTIA